MCREDGTGKHQRLGIQIKTSNPVRSWCFCHETSKSFDDVGGASIRLPCSLWKRQIPEEWTPCSRRLFVPEHTQKGSSVWNISLKQQVSSQRLPLHTPLPALASSVMLCLCDVMWFSDSLEKKNTRHQLGKGMKEITLENTPWDIRAAGTWSGDGCSIQQVFRISRTVRSGEADAHMFVVTYLTLFGAWGTLRRFVDWHRHPNQTKDK